MMIEPQNFGFNEQTATSNVFQKNVGLDKETIQNNAIKEFHQFVEKLRKHGINVCVFKDYPIPATPDSIFPNNWVSFHEDGTIILYPMLAENRRLERRSDIFMRLKSKSRFFIKQVKDYSAYENDGLFLEGTGSIVLDRVNHIAYAVYSSRTHHKILEEWSKFTGYSICGFDAKNENGSEIYHTNVLMCIADQFAVICLDAISNPQEREMVVDTLEKSGKKIISITFEQMNHFAGNMLQVHNNENKHFLVMSSQAYESLTAEQQKELKKFNKIIHSPLDTIELLGGGSARCMMAEIFLPQKP
ncbi:MAG: amidinotransferase [Bacteroidetes bacterium]|nr:amidinotransferase [Bacteroidota bacterium]MCB9042698.1 amidinotransferase [Chitinophagales bacterium]